MLEITRRKLLGSGLAMSATSIFPAMAQGETPAPPLAESVVVLNAPALDANPTVRERLLMDAGWKFALGDANDPARDFGYGSLTRERIFAKAGTIAQGKAKFDDSTWATVDLPHDWARDLPFIATKPAPEMGAHPLGREYPETSVGWYRRSFKMQPSDREKRIALQFDGIYRDATILLNGHYITRNFSGYAPVSIDISDWVNFDEPNVIAVRVDATLGDGWFYEGAGIYRHVWLTRTAALHLVEWGTYVRSEVKGEVATISFGSEIRNDSNTPQTVHVMWNVVDAAGAVVATTRSKDVSIDAWGKGECVGQTSLQKPALWSVETPNLYRAVASVYADAREIDRDSTTFGIRTVRFDADKGFFLNDKHVKIKGTCCHQDHACVGVALPDRVQYFRVERLQAMGSNALRTTHNPPTPELMEATDKLGMIVMCETRMMNSDPEGMSQLERMIRQFRNHPSIILWSLGNEEPEQGSDRGTRIVSSMLRRARELDPTRLCTVAQNGALGSGVSAAVDVVGFNYEYASIDPLRARFPKKPLIGTETASTVSTRGIYETNEKAGYVSAYDLNYPKWASTSEFWWKFYDEREFLAGGFAWTGFDYHGEPTPYSWPCVSSHFGIMDLCGFPKDNYYYYKSWWGAEPVLHLFPHWNWPASKVGEEISVWCHTNLESVELFLNGASQGTKTVARNTHVEWKVKYQPGEIEVRGSKAGKVALTSKRETVDAPAKIVLTADRTTLASDGEDVSMIRIEVQDAKGRLIPIADNEITFEVVGQGRLLGLGNGDPSSHELEGAHQRRVFNGLGQAIVQARRQAGAISLYATSAGLETGRLELTVERQQPRPAI